MPCAAKKGCGACNSCAANKGCNPCGACNPCNPCGGAPVVELTAEEAASAYDCLLKEMTTAYSKSKNPIAKNYTNFVRNSKVAYQSATHCNRFVQNLGNSYAKNYGEYENVGRSSRALCRRKTALRSPVTAKWWCDRYACCRRCLPDSIILALIGNFQ